MVYDYPYLFAVVLGLPAVILGFVFARKQRKMMLLAGVLLAALSPLSVLHDGVYWTPRRLGSEITGITAWGLEDLICTFSIGSLTWLVAIWPKAIVKDQSIPMARLMKTLGLIATGSVAAILSLQMLGIPIMVATIGIQIALIAVLIFFRPDLWAMPVRIATVYLPYYVAILSLAGAFHSRFYGMWNGPEILGPRIAHLPIEEFLWAGTLGWFPLALAFAVQVNGKSAAPRVR